MKRILSTLFTLSLLFVAYEFSQLRVAPVVDLQPQKTQPPDPLQDALKIPVEIANVEWPDEPPSKPKPKPKPKKATRPKKTRQQPAQPSNVPAQTADAGNGKASEGFDIVGQFECPVDFYLANMRQQGALTVVYENQSKRFYALAADRSLSAMDRFPAGYSALARRLTEDFPGAKTVVRSVSRRWGDGLYEILLLLPQSLELRLEQELKRIITPQIHPDKVSKVFVQYRRAGNDLLMHVDRVLAGSKEYAVNRTMRI